MIIKKICILGGSGFVGKTLANQLTKQGYELRVLTRDREKNRENLILLPTLELIEANIHDQDQLNRHFAGCDAVINLVGILNEKGRKGSGFRYAHVELAKKIINACQANGIRRLLHMSALNADAEKGTSHYLRTKGEAEDIVHNVKGLNVTSFRPSIIFGAHDSFFNLFATLLKFTPVLFPLACAKTRFAPVFVEDVATAFVKSLYDPQSYGQRYNLCGPKIYTLQELVEYTARCIGVKRHIIPLPDVISRLQAAIFDFAGFAFALLGMEKPFSTDNYLSVKIDSISQANGLKALGIPPTALEAIVPQYLTNKFQRSNYYLYRQYSRRN